MLTLEGRSPREVMQSQMFQSIQQWSTGGNLSLKQECSRHSDPLAAFKQQVASFEDILRRIRTIQNR